MDKIRESKRNSHSTMYLLKRKSTAEQTGNGAYSHSTMYLLKLQTYHSLHSCISYSHSTMYLLKPEEEKVGADAFYIHIPPCIY